MGESNPPGTLMWTKEARSLHDRSDLRYPSDLTDAEWKVLEPLMPPPACTGRPREWPMREIVNCLFYGTHTLRAA